ncbi:DNA polymerase IV [Amylibacter marinus]|uniref:DNA polymerase IV n=1 Tax=Amylibacter marinus TaxID=1475483 RepID=A0ABQ5VX39_9RHOB|nr:DNA polymerase IV [Amylibacter marinus]GLQ35774.1 DNA polymerase IV [Amylibacter marinus]
MSTICRDCLTTVPHARRCAACGSPRLLSHPELFDLPIAHMDCDAFFASVEKRDNPELRDKPVIIGGGKRGVVSTACYVARIRGVRSAMPTFQAKRLCPDAVFVAPRMQAYVEASRQIRSLMDELSPNIEPLSLDEAFIDLTGTEKLHGEAPALSMARLVKRMEEELGLSGSVGLSYNKFLAKMASDLDKPRGFSVIGQQGITEYLAPLPVKLIWGVGKVAQKTLEQDGIRTFGDIQRRERTDLAKRYQSMGDRLWHLARGLDYRHVSPRAPVKSISKETTFPEDINDIDRLDGHLWRLAEQVSASAKTKGYIGKVVTLKVKRANFQSLTRRRTQHSATQSAEAIYREARHLLNDVIDQAPFRLIGTGISNLQNADNSSQESDMLETQDSKKSEVERATDAIKQRFGKDAIKKGRALR